MYAGALLLFIGIPLLLGSWYGLAAVLVIVALLIARIVMEERTLTDELPGYREYAARVRWRLAPGVW
jgi:protein-S-isoprenylcysteine O-methyltransferase Ste14